MMEKSPMSAGTSSSRRRSPYARFAWFGAALVLFAISSFVAFRQQPRMDAYARPRLLTAYWWLHPIERNAPRRLPLIWGNLNDVFSLPGTGKVWVVGEGGLILHSDDYGRHWTRQYLARHPSLPAPQPEDNSEKILRKLYRLYRNINIYTADGSVQYADELRLNRYGVIVDGRKLNDDSLSRINPAAISTLWKVQFVDADHGWVAGESGSLFSTQNGGREWEQQEATDGKEAIRALSFSNRRDGELITDAGVGWSTNDGGKSWRKALVRLKQPVIHSNGIQVDEFHYIEGRASAKADPRHQWVVGDGGFIYATEDGGATWFDETREPPSLGTDAVANYKAIKRELFRYGPYSIWPAPLYYLSLLVIGLLLVPALKTPAAEIDPRPSIAGLLVSDRPIEAGEADVFDFNAVALGLSRFLRNENTEPPLTIGITGEWGSGKTSLMNLLRADLRRYGFRPIWFNAWHHQKEDNLLASLLEAMRAQAIPPVWRAEGLIYRGRLLFIRWARYWPVVALLLLAFSMSAGYIRSDPRRVDQAQALIDSWGEKVGAVFDVLSGKPAAKPGEVKPGAAKPAPAAGQQASPAEPPDSQHVPVAGLLLSALGLAVSVWKGMKGFGVDPASLLARDSGRIKDLQALTGFRQRFAAEFQDVTRALNPRTMLILIDDLDRCRPENVIEVLEAVNFLVSSGDCFVVMGMARERVLRCVGLNFKDVADELLDPIAPIAAPTPLVLPPATAFTPTSGAIAPSPADLARQRRLDFGQQYLEKLINIEVPVPAPTDERSRRLLATSEPQEETPEARRRRHWRETWAWARRFAPFAGFALFLVAGFYYGLTLPPRPAAPVFPPPLAQPAAPAPVPGSPSAAPSPVRQLPEPTLGEPARWHLWPLALPAVFLVGLGVWRLSIPPDVVVRDSRKFEQALATWHPLLFAWRNTPRSIKRYLNRVRYLAMLQRPAAAEPSLWRRAVDSTVRLWRRVTRRPAGEARSAAPSERPIIPEDLLVALSAIDCCHPDWLRGPHPHPLRESFYMVRGVLPEQIRILAENEAWLTRLESLCERYLEMAGGIHVS